MDKINFDYKNYKTFEDYKDIMVNAFGIGCSVCQNQDVNHVYKESPIPIGMLIKNNGSEMDDLQIEDFIAESIIEWQKIDDKCFENKIPLYLCDECFNTLNENS